MMIKLVEDPINPAVAYNSICSTFSGSVVFHYAVVKQKSASDKSTTCIDYRAQGDTELELDGIAEELKKRWKLEDVLLIRRTGCIAVGEIISLVAASSPNSEDAFEACKFGISRMKKMATIHKTERYADIA
jgi:molybdopterin synthase catalytic subunit